jgi:predicted NUDIX family NTP pyrophosphohydrolase
LIGAGAVALFSCVVCDVVAGGLFAFSAVHGAYSVPQGHYADAGLDLVAKRSRGSGGRCSRGNGWKSSALG